MKDISPSIVSKTCDFSTTDRFVDGLNLIRFMDALVGELSRRWEREHNPTAFGQNLAYGLMEFWSVGWMDVLINIHK